MSREMTDGAHQTIRMLLIDSDYITYIDQSIKITLVYHEKTMLINEQQ